jgi:uncharacterized protein (DUF983 family)
MQSNDRQSLGTVLGRGLRGRCPRCGEGALFRRGLRTHERCSECQLLFQRNNGDTWMFFILTDRIPVLIGVVAIYFGFRSTNWMASLAFAAALLIPLFATMRPRQGLALALDYLSRVYFADPSDELHGGAVRQRHA